MKIRTKLTLLIAAGMLLFGLLFIVLGAVFSIHEILIVKRHEMRDAAKRIDVLLGESGRSDVVETVKEIRNGLRFVEKRENRFAAAVFDAEGKPVFTDNDIVAGFDKASYPSTTDDYFERRSWIAWNMWTLDFHYRGENGYIHERLVQRLEIQEDLSMFFFGSLPVIALLSLLGGWIITSRLLSRIKVVEVAASEIASGNLKYRIPESLDDDELREVETNLNRAFEQLEEYFTKIMEFSSDIAHELRTPLTVISGEVEVALRESRGEEEYQETLAGILDEVSTLRKIIDDMLILVKPEKAYEAAAFDDVDISEIASDIAESYSMLGEAEGVGLSASIESGISIRGIKSLLRLVFANLVDNAIKFSSEDGNVEVVLKREGGMVVFSVSNDGSPIPSEERDTIFQRFRRSESHSGKRGVGLGLAIVKKVCDIHDAVIEVESVPGDGNTFKVVFKGN